MPPPQGMLIEAKPSGGAPAQAESPVVERATETEEVIGDAGIEPRPSAEFLSLIDHEFARRHLVLSSGRIGGIEQLTIAPSTRPAPVFNIGVRLGVPVRPTVVPPEPLAAAIDLAYQRHRDAAPSAVRPRDDADGPSVPVHGSSDLEGDLSRAVRDAERDLLSTHGKAPAVRLVDLILFEAVQRAASDIHIQPVRDGTLVRYRLDGALHTTRVLKGGSALSAAVISRVKVMARLDVAEHRAPQDGRATVTIGGSGGGAGVGPSGPERRIDLRVSTLPSTYGERIVLRLLDADRSGELLNFAAMGMPARIERAFLEQAAKPSGIVLSTGPTGSGKTTTLYTTLAWITSSNTGGQARGCELNIMTVEDPVEYDLSSAPAVHASAVQVAAESLLAIRPRSSDGGTAARAGGGFSGGLAVSQMQVDPKKNVTFATGLRHILRQDPDVIMVGEIRDQETARIAVQASLTGHLVLSTLHTGDAPGAVARLIDLGVEPFLVASSLSAVLGQRLVRRVHLSCGGLGCEHCLRTGYRGRTGVFELLVMDAVLRELVMRRASMIELKEAARSRGMVTLAQAAAALVAAGITTAQEVARVIDYEAATPGDESGLVGEGRSP